MVLSFSFSFSLNISPPRLSVVPSSMFTSLQNRYQVRIQGRAQSSSALLARINGNEECSMRIVVVRFDPLTSSCVNQTGCTTYTEMFGTFALAVGATVCASSLLGRLVLYLELLILIMTPYMLLVQVGMEFWARWAHRALWHASLWHMHEV
jgi:hypothetical protein